MPLHRILVGAAFVLTTLGPAIAQQPTPPSTPSSYAGQALGTALVTLVDTVTGNAVDAVYSVSGRVELDIAGNVVTLTGSNFTLTPPNGFIKPAGYSGPTTSFTIGSFSAQATRTPDNYPTITEPSYSDHDQNASSSGNINPILPGKIGSPTIHLNGILAPPLTSGSLVLLVSLTGGEVEIWTTFGAVASRQ